MALRVAGSTWALDLAGEEDVEVSDMDQGRDGDSAGLHDIGRPDKPLGRGLEDISHLFLSHKTDKAAATDRAVVRPNEHPSPPPRSRAGVTLLRSASVSKDWLSIVLTEFDDALEDGLRTIDRNVPCHPCGEIDLLAVDRASHLTIIDFDTTVNDDLLVRGLGHFDWVARNMPNVQRMYRDQAINLSLQPRLFLLAPQFSPLLRCVARQITRPPIHWVRYLTVEASGGPGVLFEPVESE